MATRESKDTAAARIIADRRPTSETVATANHPHSNKPPVTRINFGGVQASIWSNPGDKGDFHTVTFTRRYQEAGEWKTSNSYGAHDLLALSKVAELAVNKIIDLQQGRGRTT